MDTDRFCPSCGENAPVEVENPAPSAETTQQQYTNTNYAPPPYTPSSAPQYNPYQAQQEEMTVGKWLLTVFVTQLGCIGLIFLFIWGFGDGPKARQNYCKAMLIFMAIGVGLTILMYVFMFAVAGISMSEFYEEFDYSSVEMAASLMRNFIN